MNENTYRRVNEHMQSAQTSLRAARECMRRAIAEVTSTHSDTEGVVNLALMRDIHNTLTQSLGHMPLWKVPYTDEPSAQVTTTHEDGSVSIIASMVPSTTPPETTELGLQLLEEQEG